MRKWIALLLALVMTLLLAPTAFAAGGSAKTEDIWAQIQRIEEDALHGADNITMAERTLAYAGAVDQIAAAVQASADYVPGSLVRNGDVLFWDTVDGTGCGYSPRLRARVAETAIPDADPEAHSGIVTHSYGKRGGSPGSMNVAAFQPYYGIDSSFSTQYRDECESIAQATGGTATTYLTNNATIDNIANAIESCGVVIFDSHGDTDYASGYDYTSRANTSYICLQSGTGITNEDMVTVQGPYSTYKHAYYGGANGNMKYYLVDGTAIANHMDQNSRNGLLWMAICLGMATDGLHAPLRAKGLEVAYGYSQSVTFAGDYKWEEYFWGKMKDGDNVKDAIAYMKQKGGVKDPYTSSYPAYPIVVSSEDVYPGHGNVDKAQTVNSTWTLFPQYEINAVSNNDAWGTVSLSGNTIIAEPAEGYYASGYEIVSGEAMVTQNGNIFEVTALSDCTIQINFAPRPVATLTFSVPEGVNCEPISNYMGDDVTLPAPEGTVMAGDHVCSFLGWTTEPLENRVKEIPAYLKPGDSLTLTEETQTLYALYSYFIITEGVAGQCTLVESAPADWEGDYMITFDGTKALNASGEYTSSSIGTKKAVVDLAAAGVSKDGKILDNVPDSLLFRIAPDENGTYTVRMKNSSNYLADVNIESSSLTTVSVVKNASRWTLSMGPNGPVLTSVLHPNKTLQYNEKSALFRVYDAGSQTALSLYAAPRGITWYVTDPKDPGDEPAIPAPTITSQPQDVTETLNGSATFTVTAEGDGLSYQWQYESLADGSWNDCTDSGARTDTLTVPVTMDVDGMSFRCIVTDAYGVSVTSDAARLTVAIPDGWREIDGERYYYQNGAPVTGWQEIDGAKYYFGETGVMATLWQEIDGAKYYFGETGAMATLWQEIDGAKYYFGETGAMVTLWQEIDGAKYYFGETGAMVTLWQEIDGVKYYFGETGTMQTGWQLIDGKWYYFALDGAMQTGWQLINDKWYYFAPTGAMQTNWQLINGKWYYFSVAKGGAMAVGWQKINDVWYYLSPAQGGAMATGWQKINDVWYYFQSSGAMVTGWQRINDLWYYFQSSGAMHTGWLLDGGNWYYLQGGGVMAANTSLTLGGKVYHFNASGVCTNP